MVNDVDPEENMMERNAISVRHAGDAGDILYFLPAVKWLCAQQNTKALFYIEAATFTRTMMVPENWRGLDRVLREQSYILDVRPLRHGCYVQVNGSDFRMTMQRALRFNTKARERHLVDWMLDEHKVPSQAKDEPWITMTNPNPVAEVVINRSGPGRDNLIYHNQLFPWRRVLDKYGSKAVFVGTPLEHEVFCAVFGHVPHYPTADLYEAARVVAGCRLFIGNQSCPHAFADSMHKRVILEVWPQGPNCLSYRPGVVHGWHDAHKIELPDL